jgi:2-haloacid dehalogenase
LPQACIIYPDVIYPYVVEFDSIRLITFDCYGTLIDWETGILAALRPLFLRNGNSVADQRLLAEYGEVEAALEAGPYLRYREVLSQSVQQMGRRLGVPVSAEQGTDFAESLVTWEPFPDTVAALQALSRKFRLGIISNVDDDLFARTRKKLGVEFAYVITAQQVQSYKPCLCNFEEALRRSGLSEDQVLHAGQSLYHDIAPANTLGVRNVWVNRPSVRPGSGAVKPGAATPTHQVSSLAEMAELLGA